MIEFKLEKNQAIQQELKTLDQAMQKKALNYMLGQAVSPIVAELRRIVPTKSGALKKSLGRKTLNKKERNQFKINAFAGAVGIGATKKVNNRSQTKKLRWIEEGTKKHYIVKGNKVATFFFKGKKINAKNLLHKGSKANPILKKAWQMHQAKIADRYISSLQKWMEKNAHNHFA